MESNTPGYFELALSFVDKNIWPLIILVIVIITRKSVASALERLIKLNFSFAGATGAMEAASPVIIIEEPRQPHTDTKETIERPQEQPSQDKPKEEADFWVTRLFDAFEANDQKLAKQIFEDNQHNEADEEKQHDNEALYLYVCFIKGKDQQALEKLEKIYNLSNSDTAIKNISLWLSLIYNETNDPKRDKELLENAISRIKSESAITELTLKLALAHKNLGNINTGLKTLEDRLLVVHSDEQKSSIYESIASLLKEQGNFSAQAIALEKSVEYAPGNRERLFDAAYVQSNNDLNGLAIKNYSTLLNLDPQHSVALNNIGVSAGALNIRGKQIEFFKRSRDCGSTLAMSNLANIYLENGLYDEAQQILDEARKSDDPHENIGTSLFTLKTKTTHDNETWATTIKEAEELQRNIRLYGEACFEPHTSAIWSGNWITEKGEQVIFTIENEKISAEWTTTELRFSQTQNFLCKLSGTLQNRSAKFTYTKNMTPAKPSSLLGLSGNESTSFLAYISTENASLVFFSATETSKTKIVLNKN